MQISVTLIFLKQDKERNVMDLEWQERKEFNINQSWRWEQPHSMQTFDTDEEIDIYSWGKKEKERKSRDAKKRKRMAKQEKVLDLPDT